ncbi:MAG TPA: HemK2/MTQ2 family protein methyltransferase [Candidatus Paceibacterota bacterium]
MKYLLWKGLKFDVSNPEVYPPKPATLLLAEAASKIVRPGDTFLEVGTGSGAVAIAVAKFVKNSKVTASDINATVIRVTQHNARLNNVKIKTVVGNLFQPFKQRSFDVIAIHPPAVPYPAHTTWGLTKGMTIATNGGPDGSRLVVKSITQAVRYLKPGGELLLLLPHWSNTHKAYKALLNNYSSASTLSQKRVRFFPAIEGRPTKKLLQYITTLSKNGVIDIQRDKKSLFSMVSVIQALK